MSGNDVTMVLSYSYDENILVWDTRQMKKPLCLSSPGGGVWRIKWHPFSGDQMLTATMYDGYHVLSYSHGKGEKQQLNIGTKILALINLSQLRDQLVTVYFDCEVAASW